MKTYTKTFKYTRYDGTTYEIKVRFYGMEHGNGIYTITDLDGEHEVGLWKKQQMTYEKNGIVRESKDKNSFFLTIQKFSWAHLSNTAYFSFNDLAAHISYWQVRNGRILG